MNAETVTAIKKNAEPMADELCRMIGEIKCSPVFLADDVLKSKVLSDEGRMQILYALVLAAQTIAEEAFRLAALAAADALRARGEEVECPCEKCKAAREEKGTVQ